MEENEVNMLTLGCGDCAGMSVQCQMQGVQRLYEICYGSS